MNIEEMNIEAIEARMAEISGAIDGADADAIDAFESEMTALEARKSALVEEARKIELAAKAEEERAAAALHGEVINTRKEINTMNTEYRNSTQYIDAFAEAIKSGDFTECRALMTENADDGTIAVPTFVLDTVKTAWDKNEIMSLVNKVSVKGNLKVNFEISGDDAVIHEEGGAAVAEESLSEGIVEITCQYIKKWISITDEVLSMRGEAFLRYVYDEIAYKIVKKMADVLVGKIVALPASATASSVSADKITSAPSMALVSEAIGHLSDEASNPVIIMNKLTYSAFKAIQYANGYGVDPFEGLAVKFNNTLPAYSAASANAVYMIVGDLGEGAIANFPNGEGVEFVFDTLSRKKEDLVEVLGKEFVGLGLVANKAFTLVAKPSAT